MNSKKWECGAENANDIIATLNGTTLTFSGKGKMKDFSEESPRYPDHEPAFALPYIADPLELFFYYENTFSWKKNILERVIIEDGITHIGNCAFFNCETINNIEIPESVVSIGHAAFKNCSKIEAIELSDDIEKIGVSVFKGCYNLKSIKCTSTALHDSDCLGNRDNIVFDNKRIPNITIYVNKIYERNNEIIPNWWNQFKKITFVPSITQIEEDIAEKKQQISMLEIQIVELEKERDMFERNIKGNPKHVAKFMALFNNRDGLKYLTHDMDESGDFRFDDVLSDAIKVITENLKNYEIPISLQELLKQFVFEKNPKWDSCDNQFNIEKITSSWSSDCWLEAKDKKVHPIKLAQFAEIIKSFKRSTRLESPYLEKLIEKIFENDSFKIDKRDLSKADFYTHVGEFKTALETIFEEIQKYSKNIDGEDLPDKKNISVVYKRETCEDFFVRKIVISHYNSYPNRSDKEALIKEWLSLNKGNMGKIAEHLQGYCYWSIETMIDGKPIRVNILREKGIAEYEEIDVSEITGFTHILTFYYQ